MIRPLFPSGDRVQRHGNTATVLAILTDEESLAYDCDLEVQWDGGGCQPQRERQRPRHCPARRADHRAVAVSQIPGTVFMSHAGWRLARPDGDYERIVLPQDCRGDLIVEEHLDGGRVQLGCNSCPFEVVTDAPRTSDPDRHVESAASREGMPF